MYHSFNVKFATLLGVHKAILLNYIDYWCRRNKANKKSIYNERYWTYNTYEAFAELFPYIGIATIKRELVALEKEGWIKSKQLSENRWDKTKYYRTTNQFHGVYIQQTVDERNLLPSMEAFDTPSNGADSSHDIQLVPINKNSKPIIKNSGLPDLSLLRTANMAILRYLSTSVDDVKVDVSEALFLIDVVKEYNQMRELMSDKESRRFPQKGQMCSNVVRLHRNGIRMDEIKDTFLNMWEAKYHADTKFQYLTLEFVTRGEKFERYRVA